MGSKTTSTDADDLWKKRLLLQRSDKFLPYPCTELPGIGDYSWCLDIAVVVTKTVKSLDIHPKVRALLLLKNNDGNPELINGWGIIRHYINPRKDASKTVSRVAVDAVKSIIGFRVKDFVGDFASAELVETPDRAQQGQAGIVFLSLIVSVAESDAKHLAGAVAAISVGLREKMYRWVLKEEELEHLRLGLKEIKHVFAYEHIDPMKLLRMPIANLTSYINLSWRVSGAITRRSQDDGSPAVLLLRRTDQDEMYPGRWDFPTAEGVVYMKAAETVLRKSIEYQTGLTVVRFVDSMSRDQLTPTMLKKKAEIARAQGKRYDVRLTYRVLVKPGKVELQGYPFAWKWATEKDLINMKMSWRTQEHAMRALAPERDDDGRAAWSIAWGFTNSEELPERTGGSGEGGLGGSDISEPVAADSTQSSRRWDLLETVDEEAEHRAQARVLAQLQIQAKWAKNMAQHEEAREASVPHWNILPDDD